MMAKTIVFLADGMADEPLSELNGKTPLEAVDTPGMDSIAARGASGTFLTLPDGFPTSSDAANMSVLGYDLAECYPGRGPIEAVSQGIDLADDDIAWRCNLVTVVDGVLKDYSAGQLNDDISKKLIATLKERFDNEFVTFYPGVSYRNLMVTHGSGFSRNINFHKPDSSQGENVKDIGWTPADDSEEAKKTVEFLDELITETATCLASHPANKGVESPANHIWPWSPGKKPVFTSFFDKFGRTGAVISAVDVIFGIAKCAGMDVIKVPGATGFIDTNFEGKAHAAVKALNDHDFVYVHVEAIDECGHMGDIDLKMKAINDFDSRLVQIVLNELSGQDVTFAILPDHPVPVKLRKHTRTPVPFAVCGSHITPDPLRQYSEANALKGALGHLKGDALMRLVMGL